MKTLLFAILIVGSLTADCAPEITSCATCDDTGKCTTCKTDTHFVDPAANICVAKCPDKTFGDATDKKCVLCEASCLTCSAASAEKCITCDPAKPKFTVKTSGTGGGKDLGTCTTACESGFDDINNKCVKCNAGCICAGTVACSGCKEGYYNSGTGGNVACTGCADNNCKTCTKDSCSVCKDKFYMPTGTNAKCTACDATKCDTCTSATACLSCTGSLYVQESTCVDKCGAEYDEDTTNKKCTKKTSNADPNFGGYLFSGVTVLIAVLTLI